MFNVVTKQIHVYCKYSKFTKKHKEENKIKSTSNTLIFSVKRTTLLT